MIRLQDIADMAGVSRTTLSNVINGNTKRVSQAHGMYSLQDSFVGELVGTIQMEAEMKGYYVMLIGGKNIQNVGVDDYSGGYQIGSASYLLVLLPVLIVYIFCQKWIMNGVVAGAVK